MSRDMMDQVSSDILRRSMSGEYDTIHVILRDEKVKEQMLLQDQNKTKQPTKETIKSNNKQLKIKPSNYIHNLS